MKTLKAIRNVMKEVVALQKPLYMLGFYRNQEPTEGATVHSCGTPACILGYAVLNPAIQDGVGNDPMEVWFAVDKEVKRALPCSTFLGVNSNFIFGPDENRRQCSMSQFNGSEYEKAFSPLLTHPHLQDNHDDPAIALDFIEQVITILEGFANDS